MHQSEQLQIWEQPKKYVIVKTNVTTTCEMKKLWKLNVKKNENVIFIFTGGSPAVFAYNKEITIAITCPVGVQYSNILLI